MKDKNLEKQLKFMIQMSTDIQNDVSAFDEARTIQEFKDTTIGWLEDLKDECTLYIEKLKGCKCTR